MCWVSWDILTLPREVGGLGFKEIEIFNCALLANHTRRLLKNPNSLLGQTLLNKYCRTENILEGYAPNCSSHGWSSILAGREVIRKGLGWAIGDERTVMLWGDKWMSSSQQLSPIETPTKEAQNLRVSNLMLPNASGCNVEKVKLYRPQYEVGIRNIVLRLSTMVDSFNTFFFFLLTLYIIFSLFHLVIQHLFHFHHL